MKSIDDIMRIDFTEVHGGVFPFEMVALFNQKNISENEVKTAILSMSYNKNIIFISKEQFENVFEDAK